MTLPGVPGDALVVLVGPAGAGKSTWAAGRFLPTQVVSSDECRALVSDDASSQEANRDAFRLLHLIVGARLARGRLTVVDATNLQSGARRPLRQLATRHGRPMVAVVFQVPLDELLRRNAARERVVPEDVVRWHVSLLPAALAALPGEGFAAILGA